MFRRVVVPACGATPMARRAQQAGQDYRDLQLCLRQEWEWREPEPEAGDVWEVPSNCGCGICHVTGHKVGPQ
jgi:hypothetical protein